MEPRISLTPEAASHLRQDLDGKLLRIAFTTGCGGSGYRLASASEPQSDDVIVQIDRVRIALDDMSAKNLDGAIIDFSDDEEGYVLDHPSAAVATWCG